MFVVVDKSQMGSKEVKLNSDCSEPSAKSLAIPISRAPRPKTGRRDGNVTYARKQYILLCLPTTYVDSFGSPIVLPEDVTRVL